MPTCVTIWLSSMAHRAGVSQPLEATTSTAAASRREASRTQSRASPAKSPEEAQEVREGLGLEGGQERGTGQGVHWMERSWAQRGCCKEHTRSEGVDREICRGKEGGHRGDCCAGVRQEK